MNREMEKKLMLRKVATCAKEDWFIWNYVWDTQEFEYYSDTSKVMKDLADKYNLTLEEQDELWNHYYDYEQFLKKHYKKESQDNDRN